MTESDIAVVRVALDAAEQARLILSNEGHDPKGQLRNMSNVDDRVAWYGKASPGRERLAATLPAAREALERQTKPPSEGDLPEHLSKHVGEWLLVNEKNPEDVRWGRFPLGMVQRWIERAEKGESGPDKFFIELSLAYQKANKILEAELAALRAALTEAVKLCSVCGAHHMDGCVICASWRAALSKEPA